MISISWSEKTIFSLVAAPLPSFSDGSFREQYSIFNQIQQSIFCNTLHFIYHNLDIYIFQIPHTTHKLPSFLPEKEISRTAQCASKMATLHIFIHTITHFTVFFYLLIFQFELFYFHFVLLLSNLCYKWTLFPPETILTTMVSVCTASKDNLIEQKHVIEMIKRPFQISNSFCSPCK